MLTRVNALHLSDDTFVEVAPELIAQVVGEPERWARWWPGQTWETTRDRGVKGRQWKVTGDVVGSAEVWLEPWGEGAVVHFFLRVDPARGEWSPRRAGKEWRQASWQWKRVVTAIKDELESR